MTDEPKQQLFHLEPATSSGTDENGVYDIIPLSMLRGGELSPTKVYKQPIKHVVTTSAPAIRGWYKDKTVEPRVRPRPCYSEALLTTPYGGFCHIGCKFCYVDHGTRGYRSTGVAAVNPTYPEVVKQQIGKCLVLPAAYISSFTEPFQALEERYHNTQRLSLILKDAGLPLFYLSRRPLPDWAYDILAANPYSYCQFSVNTSNQSHLNRLSPGAIKLEQLIKVIERLKAMQVFVSIQVNPILPGITTLDDLRSVIDILSAAGARHFIFKFVEQVASNMPILFERLEDAKFDTGLLKSVMTQFIGGVKTIRQDIRVEWLTNLLAYTRSKNVTMSTCYEYYDNKHAGANMAPWFTTSDQCHGRGVPLFYRQSLSEQFAPLPGCYRKGCLYCADYGTGACQNGMLLAARALTYKDYRVLSIPPAPPSNWLIENSCTHPAYVRASLESGRNKDLATDAELWQWPALEEM